MTIQYLEKRIEELEKQVKALEQEPCDKCKYFDGNSCQHYDYKIGYTQGYEDASKRFRQEPCERFEWGIDGNVYKIIKAKDGKEICQQVCDDAVSRQAAIDTIESWLSCDDYNEAERHIMRAMQSVLYDLPPVRPQEQIGHWIKGKCDQCGGHAPFWSMASTYYESEYCHNCGAKMVEQKETETWHGIHAQITAPKGTFERIFNEEDDDYDI